MFQVCVHTRITHVVYTIMPLVLLMYYSLCSLKVNVKVLNAVDWVLNDIMLLGLIIMYPFPSTMPE